MRWIGRTRRTSRPPLRRASSIASTATASVASCGSSSICRQRGVWLDSTSTISSTVRPGWIGQVTSSTDRTASALRSRSTMARMTSPTVRRSSQDEVSRPARPVDRQQAPLRHAHQQRPARCVPELERSSACRRQHVRQACTGSSSSSTRSCNLANRSAICPTRGAAAAGRSPWFGSKRQADEFAPTLDDCVHDLADWSVRCSSLVGHRPPVWPSPTLGHSMRRTSRLADGMLIPRCAASSPILSPSVWEAITRTRSLETPISRLGSSDS